MSNTAMHQINRGAYTSPFSGVGIEYFPLGIPFDHSGLVLHETGFLPENESWNFPNVLSPFWRLYYNYREGHEVVFSDRTIPLTPDYMVLIPDHQLFHCRGDKPTPHFFCTFSVKSKLKADQPVPILFRPTGLEMELIGSAVGLFAPHVERDRIFHLCTALLYVVLSRPEIAWRQSAPASVEETIHYIEENYATPITIPRLARKVKVSTETLARSFKKFHGETLGQYILKIRVREAARWLLHSDAKIEQIAESTGLANRAYLSRVFKRITGESPAEFRRRHGRRQ